MCRSLVFFVAAWLALAVAAAQLTFSSGWKRALNSPPDACKPDQALITIYELIKSEVERLVSCQK